MDSQHHESLSAHWCSHHAGDVANVGRPSSWDSAYDSHGEFVFPSDLWPL